MNKRGFEARVKDFIKVESFILASNQPIKALSPRGKKGGKEDDIEVLLLA